MTSLALSSPLPLPGHPAPDSLGLHQLAERRWCLRVWWPGAERVSVEWRDGSCCSLQVQDWQGEGVAALFVWQGEVPNDLQGRGDYFLRIDKGGQQRRVRDPYAFMPQVAAEELFLYAEGRNCQSYQFLGAHAELRPLPGDSDAQDEDRDWAAGVCFRLWAPAAQAVFLRGEFNAWQEHGLPMWPLADSGVWELFMPQLQAGVAYVFSVQPRFGAASDVLDPYARRLVFASCDPGNEGAQERTDMLRAQVADLGGGHVWHDGHWLGRRATRDWRHQPIQVYGLQFAAWMQHVQAHSSEATLVADTLEATQSLLSQLSALACTHIELLDVLPGGPSVRGVQVNDYPLLFAPAIACCGEERLRLFIDACHRQSLGVILDWRPGQAYLQSLESAALRSLLLSSVHYWLAEFHVDGLRLDLAAAVSEEAGVAVQQLAGHIEAMVKREFPGALILRQTALS